MHRVIKDASNLPATTDVVEIDLDGHVRVLRPASTPVSRQMAAYSRLQFVGRYFTPEGALVVDEVVDQWASTVPFEVDLGGPCLRIDPTVGNVDVRLTLTVELTGIGGVEHPLWESVRRLYPGANYVRELVLGERARVRVQGPIQHAGRPAGGESYRDRSRAAFHPALGGRVIIDEVVAAVRF